MITLDLRHAIARVVTDAGFGGDVTAIDPGLRPGGRPGEYVSSVAFALARGNRGSAVSAVTGAAPADAASAASAVTGTSAATEASMATDVLAPSGNGLAIEIAGRLGACLKDRYGWIAEAKATGAGYLTITVTPKTISSLAPRVADAGPDCVRSDALAGLVFPAPDVTPWETAGTWEEARDLLAGHLTSRLAVAAGASIEVGPGGGTGAGSGDRSGGADDCSGRIRDCSTEASKNGAEVEAAVAFAGADAVLFSLAMATPGRSVKM
ncbi:MAG: hypothetical protein ACRDN0_18410, partial [Trebonia sp.]